MTLVGPFQQLPSAKYQIMEHPGALPGCCFMCRSDSTNREWFVDVGLQFDLHGAVYICNMCLWEMATTVGWLTPEETDRLKQQVSDLRTEAYHLRRELAALRDLEDAIDTFVSNRLGRPDEPLGASPVPSQLRLYETTDNVEEPLGHGEGLERTAGESVGTGTGATPEPLDVQGMADLRSDGGSPFSL